MSFRSNKSEGGLWLTEKETVPKAHMNLHSWGERCIQIFLKHHDYSHIWVGVGEDVASVHWAAGTSPLELLPEYFSLIVLTEVMASGKDRILKDNSRSISAGIFPFIYEGQVLGVIGLVCSDTDHFNMEAVNWIRTLTLAMAGGFAREKSWDEKLDMEHSIFHMLRSSQDIRSELPKILDILTHVLEADAITALWYIPITQRFELLAAHGLSSEAASRLKFQHETGLASGLLENLPLTIHDLQDHSSDVHPISRLAEEEYRGYLALPLTVRSETLGCVEIVWRTPRQEISASESLLHILEQLAFALENTFLLLEYKENNAGWMSRYNSMIEGLSRALELRDLETQGHTRRVSQLTMRLVEHMNIPSDQWDAIRQGALLHDIGKIGIPDAILLKPGSLTPREREVMQQHVIYGYNILAPIINSQLTLDIVLYHHEYWGGKGYPHGLQGEQIPFMARLFAVVDVFDALTSDRPYRTAWSRTQALDYLKEKSGDWFDPQIVEAFLEIANALR